MPTPASLPTSMDTAAIAGRIAADGYAVIEDYVAPDQLRRAQDFVRTAVARNGGNYLAINGAKGLEGTFLHDWPDDTAFIALCRGIYERTSGKSAPQTSFYQVLRCLSGDLAARHSLKFHYDSYLLTALIPIIIPDRGKTGDLLIIPNWRRLRSHYALNFLDKILLDNPLSQWMLRKLYERGYRGIRHLKLKPGNLYLFNGYRSIHTNEACDPDAIRSTALLHYVDPHEGSSLKRLMRKH